MFPMVTLTGARHGGVEGSVCRALLFRVGHGEERSGLTCL